MNRGDKITTIYNVYVNDLFTYGLYLGFDKESVKDAIHDVFLKLSTNRNLLDNAENIKFYLFRSLKNRLIDTHKNRKEHVTLEAMDTSLELPFNMTVNVETLMIAEEEKIQIKHEITQMLDTLTPRQREIIYLRYVQEYDYKHISKLLQISVHGCRKLVSKAIVSLREQFDSKR